MDGEEEEAPRTRPRFADRLCFQSFPSPGRAFRGAGPRDYPLKELLGYLHWRARNARRRAVERRRTPTTAFRTRAAKLRRP
jgi:hypothetical protein